jgi:hypothetical protein
MRGKISAGGVGLIALAASGPAFAQASSEPDYSTMVGVIVFLIVAAFIYFIPSIVAFRRSHPNRWPILIINFLFGGTGLGWLGSLVWACGAVHKSPTGSNGGESGLNVFVNDPVTVIPAPGSAPLLVEQSSPEDKLQRLKRLLDAGAITAEEYAGLRKPLIDRLLG